MKNRGKVTQRFSATQLRELLHRVGVNNDSQLIGNDKQPYIAYRKADYSRGGHGSPAWQVITPGYRTDPDGAYRDGYWKTFRGATHSEQDPQLAAARKWAEEQYHVFTWVKTPFGSWTSEAHLKHRLAVLLPEQFGSALATPDESPVEHTPTHRYKVVVYLNSDRPERPLWVNATSHDTAKDQVVRLLVRVGGTRVLAGLRAYASLDDGTSNHRRTGVND